MRRPIVAANWKMNTTLADAHLLANGVRNEAEHIERIDIVLAPPTIWLTELAHGGIAPRQLPHLKLAVQNIYSEESGAFTGETSPVMAKEVAEYALIGHSDRVYIFGESWELIADKLKAAFHYGLKPILCIGEHEKSFDSKRKTGEVLEFLIKDLSAKQIEELTVAYEPIWAISRGNPNVPAATPEYAQEVISYLRGLVSDKTRILYGGSSNDKNAKELIEQPDIDGFLVGGASLKLKSFVTMCHIVENYASKSKD